MIKKNNLSRIKSIKYLVSIITKYLESYTIILNKYVGNHKRIILIILIYFALLPGQVKSAQVFDPSLKWRSIKTTHFWIHYHQGLEDVAQKMAKIAEKVHAQLSVEIGWQPALRTDVVLVDNTDLANGNARPVPFNRVELYISRPRNDSVLHNYDEWLESVFLHEYVHILNLDIAHKFPQGMRYILGRFPLFFPNIFSPVFVTEGSAVYHESKNSKFGRNNSTYTDMIIRNDVANDGLKSIDKAAHFPRTWPMGGVPYLYGGLFVEYLEGRYGRGTFAKYFHNVGDNVIPFGDHISPIPYFFNKNIKDIYGKAFHTLWKEWQQETYKKQMVNIERIKRKGLSKFKHISNKKDDSTFPKFSKDGKYIYYVNSSRKKGRKLYKYDIKKKKNKTVGRVNYPGSLTITKNNGIYLTDLEYHNSFSLYYDIFKYGLIYKKKTKKNRSTYIDSFNKSNKFVFTQKNNDKYSLAISNSKLKKKRYLIKDTDIQISYPAVSPDDKLIVFNIRETNGNTDLVLMNLQSKKFQRLTNDIHNDIHPAWHPGGDRIIFTSDRDGVYNLYEYNLKRKKISRMTNVIGGAFYSDISSDAKKIVFSSYEKNGHRVSVMNYPVKSFGTENAKPKNLDKSFFISKKSKSRNTDNKFKTYRYNPFNSAFPAFVVPLFGTVEYYPKNYDIGFGFMIMGSDTLFHHFYTLQMLIYPMQKNISLGVSYTFSMLYPDITIGYFDNTLFMGDDEFPWDNKQSGKFNRTTMRSGYVNLMIPIIFYTHRHYFDIAYYIEQTFTDEYTPVNQVDREEDLLARVAVSYTMDFTKIYTYSISQEDGLYFFVASDIYHEKLASDETFYKLKGQLDAFIPGFAANNVFMLRLRGAMTFDYPNDIPAPYGLGKLARTYISFLPSGGDWGMRGYSSGLISGERLAIGTIEYRFPIVQVDEGTHTFPLMFRDLWFEIFYEYGNVWNGSTNFKDFKSSVGIEINFNVTLGYYIDMVSYVGYAYGIDNPGEHQVYFAISTFLEGRFLNRGRKKKIYFE